MEENYKITQWFNDDLEPEALKEFEAQPDFEFYNKIKKYSAELQTPHFDETEMLNTILQSKKQTRKTKRLLLWMGRIAAVLILAITITYTYRFAGSTTQLAEKTKTTHFLLPDASQVVLNADSKASYNRFTWSTNRQIALEGEAFFKVAKGKKFEVQTHLGKITVLGTHFNVKARDNRLDVVCYEGRVLVSYKNSKKVITKNESVAYENGKILQVAIPNSVEPEWLNQQIAFSQATLTAITKELERQYGITISTAPNLSQQLFTGKIPANNWDNALQIVTATYHLNAIQKSANHYLLTPMHAKE
ncbi:FecR family protein [Flavobacterium sp.]|uniref:FecR family protein n=1 Tax=Flavobacterium sp. TaxID=239 RepID=UPI003D0C3D87